MTTYSYPNYPPRHGYMSETIQQKYITSAVEKNLLPAQAHRMPQVVSLIAPNDEKTPIQFWQLYSVLGQQAIVRIVSEFYERVYDDEEWFRSVFARIGDTRHHIATQASMWLDVMGGGHAYHGGEFRLNFHHTHNAMQLMNDKGAARWSELMVQTLDQAGRHMTEDPRVRVSLNTFLSFFFSKYAADFNFGDTAVFGPTNPPFVHRINFMNMTEQAIEALSEAELRSALAGRGVDDSLLQNKRQLVDKALAM